jgi:carbamate kinase
LTIIEEPIIRTLVESAAVTIALGGGGVPIVRRHGALESVEAVIDKDLGSALLASRLPVDVFVMSTDVDYVYVNFAREDARPLVGPKVDAALRFVAAGGREAIVTSPARMAAALGGRDGTHVVAHAMPVEARQ